MARSQSLRETTYQHKVWSDRRRSRESSDGILSTILAISWLSIREQVSHSCPFFLSLFESRFLRFPLRGVIKRIRPYLTFIHTDGAEARPLETITPLAQALGLVVDTSVKRDDGKGVADVVNNYSGAGNILICWEHKNLHEIMKALGVKHAPHYPDDR
jgi:hypothetical protein